MVVVISPRDGAHLVESIYVVRTIQYSSLEAVEGPTAQSHRYYDPPRLQSEPESRCEEISDYRMEESNPNDAHREQFSSTHALPYSSKKITTNYRSIRKFPVDTRRDTACEYLVDGDDAAGMESLMQVSTRRPSSVDTCESVPPNLCYGGRSNGTSSVMPHQLDIETQKMTEKFPFESEPAKEEMTWSADGVYWYVASAAHAERGSNGETTTAPPQYVEKSPKMCQYSERVRRPPTMDPMLCYEERISPLLNTCSKEKVTREGDTRKGSSVTTATCSLQNTRCTEKSVFSSMRAETCSRASNESSMSGNQDRYECAVDKYHASSQKLSQSDLVLEGSHKISKATHKDDHPSHSAIKFWSTVAVLAADSIMSTGGTESTANCVAGLILDSAMEQEVSEAALRNVATKASVAVLSSGGNNNCASAAAVAILNARTLDAFSGNGESTDRSQMSRLLTNSSAKGIEGGVSETDRTCTTQLPSSSEQHMLKSNMAPKMTGISTTAQTTAAAVHDGCQKIGEMELPPSNPVSPLNSIEDGGHTNITEKADVNAEKRYGLEEPSNTVALGRDCDLGRVSCRIKQKLQHQVSSLKQLVNAEATNLGSTVRQEEITSCSDGKRPSETAANHGCSSYSDIPTTLSCLEILTDCICNGAYNVESESTMPLVINRRALHTSLPCYLSEIKELEGKSAMNDLESTDHEIEVAWAKSQDMSIASDDTEKWSNVSLPSPSKAKTKRGAIASKKKHVKRFLSRFLPSG